MIAYSDGEVRQQFNLTYAGQVTGGTIKVSSESAEVRFIHPSELASLPIHATVRLRLQHHAERREQPYLG